MNIEQNTVGEIQLVKFSGRLTSNVAKPAKDEILKAIDISNRVVIDCSELEYVDSTGLGTLVSGLKKALSLDGDLRLGEIMPKVAMLLELTKADKVFKIYPKVDDAINSYDTTHPLEKNI